ncbi:MAG: hypothetical protein IPJ90_07505 [Anaerolineaceae bacterium]|nr:hypothetical protein [Anaerolineaceae bacterium]
MPTKCKSNASMPPWLNCSKNNKRVLLLAFFNGYSHSQIADQPGNALGHGQNAHPAGDAKTKKLVLQP